ncbi:MAG: ABC transporter ATP-binding protein [Gemmatimonadota bacterium]
MTATCTCRGLSKAYRGFRLGPLDLELEPGTVLGYVGLNGAGKTTTMNCLSGLVKADAGQVEIAGRPNDPADPLWKADVAFVTDEPLFYDRWTGARNLRILAGYYPAWSEAAAGALAHRFSLPLDRPVRDLSRGNRTKLAVTAALAASSRLLLLDEPTAGLDPVVREEVLGALFEQLEGGERALFYSTHLLTDIARLADELAFLADGQLVLRESVADLTDRWRAVSYRCPEGAPDPVATVRVEREGERRRVISADGEATLRHLAELGATQVQAAALGIDAIAVEILKGDYRVAAG